MENQLKKSRSNTFPRSLSTSKDFNHEKDNKSIGSPSLEAKSVPRSHTKSKTVSSYATSRKPKQERISSYSKLTKITNNLKTKFLTVKDDNLLRKYNSDERIENESFISDTKIEFMETIKHEDEELITGIRKFNLRPNQGIDYFIEHKFISTRTPSAVARFLYKESQSTDEKVSEHWQLDKKNIGLYLGDVNDFNVKVLDEFVKLHDFKGLSYDSALRIFLEEFFLPGESQIIDRMMQKFAYHYCNQNKDAFSSPDTAYILAFSIILLNTDLHNSRIKRKMTKEEFIKNNKGIDNGNDLPTDYLSYIYDNISQNEIKSKTGDIELDTTKSITKVLNDISYSFTNPNMEGWLYKRGGIGKKQWKKKWCVVANSCMYFFPNKNKEKTIGILPLCDLTVSTYDYENNSPSGNTQYLFSNFIKSFTKTRYYFIIKAKSKKEKEMMKKASSQNSLEGESIPNFAITDNNQKVLYSKHVNGKVIADIQDYYIFAVDTKEKCEYWVYIIESQIHDSMAAYRSLAAVKRHSLIQKKDIDTETTNSSDIDLTQHSESENSQTTKIIKDNFLYNMESTSNIERHNSNNKTLVDNITSIPTSSKDKINSTNIVNSTDHTLENINEDTNDTDNTSKRLSLEFSEIVFSSIKDKLQDENDNNLNKVEIIPLNYMNDDEENEKDKDKSKNKSKNKDKDKNKNKNKNKEKEKEKEKEKNEDEEKEKEKGKGKSSLFRNSQYIPRKFQKLNSDTNIISSLGISSSLNNSLLSNSKIHSCSVDAINKNEKSKNYNKNDTDYSIDLSSFSSFNITFDSIGSLNKDNKEPNYVYGSINTENKPLYSVKNKSSFCDLNETSDMNSTAIKELNSHSHDQEPNPNLSSLDFNQTTLKSLKNQKQSFDDIEFEDCHEFFEDQSNIPKSELKIDETKFLNENSILTEANLSSSFNKIK
ncbi:Sec7-domain-containing protein [Neocallimastix lanati (nom. inval.)]|nr:Sec7-domain-containing protein [Neocallimastix sp. JGI-2020a]